MAAAARDEVALPPTGFGTSLLKMVLALLVVCLLAYIALRIARHYLGGPRGEGRKLRVVDRTPLSPRQTLWIVEVAGKHLLLGATDQTITLLARLDGDRLSQTAAASGFKELLKEPPSGEGA